MWLGFSINSIQMEISNELVDSSGPSKKRTFIILSRGGNVIASPGIVKSRSILLLKGHANVAGIKHQSPEHFRDKHQSEGSVGHIAHNLFTACALGILIQEEPEYSGAQKGQDHPDQ